MSSANNTLIKKKPAKTTAFFICVLVAAFLWLVKSLNTTYNHSLKVPVEFKNLPQNKKPLNNIPEFVNIDIKVNGLKLFLILLNQPFKKIEIDFNNLKSVNKNYILTAATVDFKKSLKFETNIKQIDPDTLYFIENNGYQKNVPIKVVCSLKGAQGYGFKSPVVNPAFLTIVGDSSSIANIDTIYTQTFIMDNLNATLEKKLPVLKPTSEVYLNVSSVNVSIEVEKLIEQSIYLPINIINTPANVKSVHVFPARVKVKFTSLQNDFNQADTVNFKAVVNVLNNNKGKCPVYLSTQPGHVNVLLMDPKETEVLIIKK